MVEANAKIEGVVNRSIQKKYFENLDFLRVVAFLMVFFSHVQIGQLISRVYNNSVLHGFLGIASDGGLGVSFFFVLSGFLITYLLLKEKKDKGYIDLGHFYVRRFLRIWPLYFLVLIFGFVVYPELKLLLGIRSDIANNWGYYFSFLSNFDLIDIANKDLQGKSVAMIGITWSVAIEEQFYLVWPLFFLLMPKRYYGWIFYFVIVASLLFRYLNRMDGNLVYFHTLSAASDLAFGGLAAWYCINKPRFVYFFTDLPKPVIVLLYLCGFALLFFRDDIYPENYFVVFARFFHAIFFAFVILEQNLSKKSFIKFSVFDRVSKIGKYTYGLYLLHPIALQLIELGLRAIHVSTTTMAGGLTYALLGLLVSLVLSYLSYTYMETYFLKLKSRFA